MDALRIDRDDDLLRITLARPESRNAFDEGLIGELAEAFVDVGKARAVVLSGEGPSFCAGADIEWMRRGVELSEDENVAEANALRRMFDAIDTCPAPVIAVVQGHALGGGAGLVATADVALAHDDAVFAFSEVKLGIIPAVISPYALRKIGESAARRYFVTGERFDALTALRIGLVHEVTRDLDLALARIVSELRSAGPRAARHAKRLVLERPDGPETARRIAERRASAEGQDGLRAFVERRRPELVAALRFTTVTALLALVSAVLVGGADFLGGMASRSTSGVRAAAFAAVAGLPFALAASIAYGAERVTGADVAWSLLGGLAVAIGIGCFYTAMGRGLISVVAPVAAVTGAIVPVVYALARGERPGTVVVIGLAVALGAVIVVSIAPTDQHADAGAVNASVVGLAVLSGTFFGLFYIAFSRPSDDAGLWPVTLARVATSIVLVVLAIALTRGPLLQGGRRLLSFGLPIGVLEVAATVPLLLALQRGPVAVASVVASLYPVTTVLLAGIVLRERLSRLQYVGVCCALVAVALVSSG